MKQLFVPAILCSFIFLLSCVNSDIPQPAITFSDTENMLKQKETNKLISQSFWQDSLTDMSSATKYNTYKYVTTHDDTIRYIFSNNNLAGIMIDVNNFKLDDIVKKYDANNMATKVRKNQYTIGNDYIILGRSKSNGKPYIVILNNIDNEVSDIIGTWQKWDNKDGYNNLPSADAVYCYFELSKLGEMVGYMLLGPTLLHMMGEEQRTGRYYDNLFMEAAKIMAEIEREYQEKSATYFAPND